METGSLSSQPLAYLGKIFVGTDDGDMLCLSAFDGSTEWKYESRGPILRPAAIFRTAGKSGQLVFANENDHVYALDLETGKQLTKWVFCIN